MTSFIKANLQKILDLSPNLVIGFSDIQKDIARDLISQGLDVYISNQRSIQEILRYIKILSGIVGAVNEGEILVLELLGIIQKAKEIRGAKRPKIYFEEWDEPQITAIRWVSEIIEIAGGEDIFSSKSSGSLAKERFVSSDEVVEQNPDIIFGCWCGKKFDLSSMVNRPNWNKINAVKNSQVYELDPAIFLQPGPAPILEGISILQQYLIDFSKA